jgi:hypothetical protein
MRSSDRRLLARLRDALVPLHRTLLEWERAAYERVHGRTAPAELLRATVTDPQFAWLRPVSSLIVRIDGLLEPAAMDQPADVPAIVSEARELVAPDEAGTSYAQRYHAALQQAPDVVFAHRRVTIVLREAEPQETLH